MKNKEFIDSASMYQKINPCELDVELRKQLLDSFEADLQNYTDDPQGYQALMIAINNIKSSLNQ